MTYDNAYSIDDLVQDKKKFVNKIVPVNGNLVEYSLGPGIVTWPMVLKLEGDQYRITVRCQISRAAGDPQKIRPYLDAYLGEPIGIKVFANDYTITDMKFGEDAFEVRS